MCVAMAGGFPPSAAEAETSACIEAARAEPLQSSDHLEGVEIRGDEAGPRRAALRENRHCHRRSHHRGTATVHPVLRIPLKLNPIIYCFTLSWLCNKMAGLYQKERVTSSSFFILWLAQAQAAAQFQCRHQENFDSAPAGSNFG